MLINFAELTTGDDLEDFCHSFFQALGWIVEKTSSRGPDGGVDLIVIEPTTHPYGVRWLVSCKNTSQANNMQGRKVGSGEEQFSGNKLLEYNCHGFLAIYPMGLTSGLHRELKNHCDNVHRYLRIIQGGELSIKLARDTRFYPLLRNFFPVSYQRLVQLKNIQYCERCGCPFFNCTDKNALEIMGRFSNGRYIKYFKTPELNTVSYEEICDQCYNETLEEIRYGMTTGVAVDILEDPIYGW